MKQTQAAVESETLFRTLAETTSAAMWIVQEERIQYANPAAQTLTGYSVQQMQGMLFTDLVHPAARGRLPVGWPRRLPPGSVITLLTASGERQLNLSAAEMEMDGQPAVLLTAFTITSHEWASRHALRAAAEMKAIFNTITEAIVVYGPQGDLLQANALVERIYGVSASGQNLRDIQQVLELRAPDGRRIPTDEWPSALALNGQAVYEQPYTLTNRDGETFHVVVSSLPLFVDGEFSGAVASYRDVSEQFRLLSDLSSERARLSAIIQSAPEAILVFDLDNRIRLANQSAEKLIGSALELNRTPEELGLQLLTAEGQPIPEELTPMMRSARNGETLTNQELSLALPDGSRRELLINSSPIVEADGTISGAVTLAQDFTVRKHSEQHSRNAAARAELLATLSKAFAEAGLYHAAVLTSISIQISERIRDTSIIRMQSDDGRWLDVVAVHHPDSHALRGLRKVINDHRVRLDHSLEGDAFRNREPILISDISAFEDRKQLEGQYGDWLWENNTRSMLVVPLLAQDDVMGTLTMIRNEGEPYTEDDQHFFTNLADRAALAIENSRLFVQEQQRAREMDALNTATAALLNTLDLDELLAQILNSAQNAIPSADHSALHLIEPETGQLQVHATLNDKRIARLSSSSGMDYPAFVIKNREPLLINDTLTSPEQTTEGRSRNNVRSLIIAPLIIGGEILGTLSLTAARSHAFTREDMQLLISFAATTSAAIQNARLHAQVQMLAITDPLTELYNRRGFSELAQREMDRYLRYQSPLTAIMMDIDHFKEVNDNFGHQVGDRVLQALAERVAQNIRHVDILGRYGGEEFILLLPNTELSMACEIAERIRHSVESLPMVETEQGSVQVTVSLGVSNARPGVRTLDELLEQADQALYQAKQNGRNRLEIK